MAAPVGDILVSTLAFVRQEAVDNLFRTSQILDWAQSKGVIKELTGGASIQHPTILAEHSTIVDLGAEGYNPVNETVTDPLVTASFNWSNFSAPVILTKIEEMANRGSEARVSILEARMKTVLGQITRAIETQLFAGSSTVVPTLESLNGVDTKTGWFEEVAFGSQSNTIGGIAKASYPTAWQNQVADAAGAFATNGILQMSEAIIQASTYAPEGQVDGVFLSPTAYALLKNELQVQERYTMADKSEDAGRLTLQWNGAPCMITRDLGGTYGATKLSGYGLNSKSLTIYFDKDGKMELLSPVAVSAALAHRQDILTRMQAALSHAASNFVLVNAEA